MRSLEIKERLEKELESRGIISDKQYDFRKTRSTVKAVDEVIKLAKD